MFDALYEFDEPTRVWRAAAKLRHSRFYNGTAALDGKIWVIAGNRRDADGAARPLSTVEVCDPLTGDVQPGPDLPYAIEMPLAVHIGQRIYVAGNERLLSIGSGESLWTREPDMPATDGLKALAGAAWDRHFYITIAKLSLTDFDTAKHAWSMASVDYRPRSRQVAAFRNAIWVMGGRDIPDGRSTMIFDLSTRHWRRGPDLPRELAWGAAGRCYSNRTFLLL